MLFRSLETEGVKPWRLLISEYRRTRQRIASLTSTGRAPGAKSSLATVQAVQTHQRNEATFVQREYLGAEVFRDGWQGRNSGWPRLRLATQWLLELNDEIAEGQMPQALLDYLGRAPDSGDRKSVV